MMMMMMMMVMMMMMMMMMIHAFPGSIFFSNINDSFRPDPWSGM